MLVRRTRLAWLCACLLAATSCGKSDNSAATDKASDDLRKAQGAASEQRTGVIANEAEIERTKREVASAQQALADQQALLTRQRQELGSAQAGVEQARNAYAAAVAERFAKLDASLASLATKTDAAAKDAQVGLRARRDQLAAKLAALRTTTDPGWTEYTKDVDTTFDAIERDLNAATR